MTSATPLLEMRDIHKSFGSTRALRGVDLTLRPGEVRALLGSNGAGKSTLIKILDGIHRQDRGTVETRRTDGAPGGRVRFIHQDLGLVDALTVRENMQLSRGGITRRGGFISAKQEREATRTSLGRVGLSMHPDTRLVELSLGEKSLVAVARLLDEQADVLVLDEVTAALTREESDWLLTEVANAAETGLAVVVVTHRLAEVTAHCDSVTVIEDGSVAFDGPTPSLSQLHDVVSSGAWSASTVDRRVIDAERQPVLLRAASAGTPTVGPVDLEIRAGEILGLVGSVSSGLYEIGHLLAGHEPLTTGTVTAISSVGSDRGRAALVPEDRVGQARLDGLTIAENMSLGILCEPSASNWGVVRRRHVRELIDVGMRRMKVKPDDPSAAISNLSGGNQQKVMVSRAAMTEPDILVLCEPTRGVDVQTRQTIHAFAREYADRGKAVVVLSIDVDEVISIADRVGVVTAGVVSSPEDASYVSADQILARSL